VLRKSTQDDSLLSVKASELEVKRPAIVSGLILDVMSGRLMSLGIRKGAQIQKLRKTTGGGILFRVEEHRVVLHRSLAELIEVREEI
jgi:Fe2+ transport system protein FeoA